MIPRPAEVVRRRLTALMVLRLASVGLASLTIYPLASWLAEGIRDDDIASFGYYSDRIALAAAMPIAALLLALLSRPLSRWCVRVKSWTHCPRCSYRLEGLTEPRCPECGLSLGREFLLAEPLPADHDPSPTALLVRRRGRVVLILRLFGVFAALWAVLGALSAATVWVLLSSYDDAFIAVFSQSIAVALGYGLAATAFLCFARPLARRIVPRPDTVPSDESPPPRPPTPSPGDLS